MNWIDYREQLGIGFDNKSKLQMCINRIKNILSDLSEYYRDDDLFLYMNIVGEDYSMYDGLGYNPLNVALESVCRSKSLKEFISKYVALTNSTKKTKAVDNGEKNLSRLFEAAIFGTLESMKNLPS